MSTVPNRRDQLRERHRAAILHAGHELLDETGSAQFSADALAERADISRRTVFNHFASIDDVVTQVCADVFADAIDEISAVVHDADADVNSTMFDRIAPVFRSADLTPQIAYLGRVLGAEGPNGRTAHLLPAVFTRVTAILTAAATAGPDGDDPDAEILVHALMSGIAVNANRWVTRFDGVLDADSRAVWFELVDHLLDRLGRGFAAPGRP